MIKMMRVTEFAKRVGRSAATLRRWDNDGTLVAKRTVTGQRYYDEDDYRKVLKIGLPEENSGKTVLYSRVSSHTQKHDLESQQAALEEFCAARGLTIDERYSDVASGLNFKRRDFLRLMNEVENGNIETLVIAHKDRFARFGYDYFEARVEAHGGEILVLNAETLSPQEELVQDLLSIVHVFSSRLYGLRRYHRSIKKDAENGALDE
jgi:predicted site-specific integrase-resolvase